MYVVVAAIILLLAGGALAYSFIPRHQTPTSSPTPSPLPALNTSERSQIKDLSQPITQLTVTDVLAEIAKLSQLQAKTLEVQGDASFSSNIGVAGNGTFGGTVQAANLSGNGANVSAVNAALLNGQPGSFYRSAANLQGSLSIAQLPAGVALQDSANTFTRANIFTGNVTVGGPTTLGGTTTIANLVLGSALGVGQGGTGLGSVPAGAVLFGQGGGVLGTTTAASTGLCLMSTASTPVFAACPGGAGSVLSVDGLTGALTINDSSGSGTTITINDATTGSKGIAEFTATNFSVAAGVVNTVQNIAVTSSPTFAGLSLSTPLAITSGGTGAATAVGARSNLGAAASGANSDITSLLGLTTPLSVTQGGTGATSAVSARSNLGAATSGANSDITALLGLTTALSVSQGGTGTASLAAGGVLVGNGTSAVSSATGTNGQCLIIAGGTPAFGACPGSGGVASVNVATGAIVIQGNDAASVTTVGGTITISDASAAVKGLASFNSTNFSVAAGVVNTVQDIAVAASPTFASLTVTGASSLSLGTSGAGGAAGSVSFYDGSSSFAARLNATTLTASQTISLPNESGTICLQNSANCGFLSTGNTVLLQATTPGSMQTGNFNVSGTGLVGSLSADSVQATGAGTGLAVTNNATVGGTLAVTGTATVTGTFTAQGNSTLGANSTTRLTLGSEIVGGAIIFQGATDDAFTQTFQIADPTINRTVTLANTSGTIALQTSGSSQNGVSAFIQGGSAWNGAANLGTNDANAINFRTNSTTRLTIDATGNLTFASGAGNFDQSASTGTFATGSGAVTLGGDTTLAAGKSLGINGAATFQPAVDSTTAFTIRNSSATPLVSVDSTGSGTVTIGNPTADATATLLVVDTKNTAGDPTGTNGGIYYNSSTGTFRCYQNGAWTDCISSAAGPTTDLQSAYTLSTGGSTPEIKLDATRGGLDLQDADSALGANLLTVRASNAGGLGAALLAINSTGQTTFRNSSDSTSAFVIQDSGGNALFTADSSGKQIILGQSSANNATLKFANASNANVITVTSNTSASATLTLPAETGTLCVQNSANCGFATTAGTVALQGSTPGSAQTGNFNITGTGIAGRLSATGSGTGLAVTNDATVGGTLAVTGATTLTGALTVNNSTTLGAASTDRITLTAQLLGGSPFVFQGAVDDAFTTTINVSNPTANRVITLPNNSGTLALATSGSSTVGTSAFIQGGSTWAGAANLGTNDANALNFRTNSTTRLTIDSSGNVSFASGAGNFDQSGSTGTFATGSGTVTLNGSTTVASNKSFTAGGAATFQDATNSATAFVIQNSTGTAALTVDTTNLAVRLADSGNLVLGSTVGNSQSAVTKDFICTSTEQTNDIVVVSAAGTVAQTNVADKTSVAGVVVAKPNATTCRVAVAGEVKVQFGSNAAPGFGDPIATSTVAGAARAVPSPTVVGSIIGKAMDNAKDGSNLVWVLLN